MPSQTFVCTGQGAKPFGSSVTITNIEMVVNVLGYEVSVLSATVPRKLGKTGWIGLGVATLSAPAVGIEWWHYVEFEYQYIFGAPVNTMSDQLVYHLSPGTQVTVKVYY